MTAPWFGCSSSSWPTRSGGVTSSWISSGLGARGGYICPLPANYTDYVQSAQQTARTDGGTGFTRGLNSSYGSGNTFASWLNSAGIEVLRIRSTSGNVMQLQYWNGSSWTGVGSGASITGGSTLVIRWQLDFTGLGSGSGSLHIRALRDDNEGVLWEESASGLTLTSATNIDRLRCYAQNSTAAVYAPYEGFIKDGSAMSVLVYSQRLSADGTDTGGSGDVLSVDDNNTSSPDTDLSSLTASGDRESYRSAARTFGGRNVKGVGFDVRLRRGATGPTDCKPYLRIGSTRYYHASSPVTLTTSFVDYTFIWELDPSTAAAWGATNAESTNLEYGIEVA